MFGAHGFATATMEAIATDADVAKGTVYLYYDSKRAIYDGGVADQHGGARSAGESARRVGGDACRTAIAAFVAARVEFFQARQDFFRMYVEEIGSPGRRRPKARRTLCGTMIDRQIRILEKLVAAAVERGEVRAGRSGGHGAGGVRHDPRPGGAPPARTATERHGPRRGVPHRSDLDRPAAGAKKADVMNVRTLILFGLLAAGPGRGRRADAGEPVPRQRPAAGAAVAAAGARCR